MTLHSGIITVSSFLCELVMISIFRAALLVVALALASCSNGVIAHIDIDQDVPETVVNGNVLGGTLPGAFPEIPLDVTSESAYEQEDGRLVQTVQLDALFLSITANSTDPSRDSLEDGRADNFDFLDSLTVVILATINGEASEAQIATLPTGDPQLGSSQSQVALQTTGVDILPYVEAPDGYRIQVRATGQLPPDDVAFNGVARYRVGIGF